MLLSMLRVCTLFATSDCRFNIHQKCCNFVIFKCPGKETDIDADCSKVKHKWESTTYTTPTFCDDCGMLLHGVAHQGVKCESKCARDLHFAFAYIFALPWFLSQPQIAIWMCITLARRRCLRSVALILMNCAANVCCMWSSRATRWWWRVSQRRFLISEIIFMLYWCRYLYVFIYLICVFICLSFILYPAFSVKEATNLIPMDTNGLSDPYVAIALHPDRSGKTKKKTKTIQKCLSPVYNEKFTLWV